MADTKSGQLFTRLEYELPETVRQVVCILNDARHHGTDLVLDAPARVGGDGAHVGERGARNARPAR